METQLLQNYRKIKPTYSTKRRKKGNAASGASKKGGGTRNMASQEAKFGSEMIPPAATPELTTYGGVKLGWIQGVLIPCLLNIWGVMLFLRIAWIVAQAGVGLTMVIILISGVVCVITTLSLSAICTNGELKGGGVYYLVSRSLGAELGASVGLIFAFANAVAASMNTIGFCDSLNELLRSNGLKIIDNGANDTRIVGTMALFVMCVICAIGMDWETKTQNFLITVIVIAIFNYIIGACIGPRNNTEIAQGFVGISAKTIEQNLKPDFRFSEGVHHDFFTVFAMYFPAVTGVQAGANICGDLRDPATAIPKGTLLAVTISLISYATMALLSGAGALRDASGDVRNLTHAALASCVPNCSYGLHNNYQVMQLMSAWGSLIYGGCWAATLSTALTNLLSVPRLIQALGVDRIYPGLIFFSKPYGKHGEPYRGYVLTFLVSMSFLLIADLNTIAPLISNFYLASYALINFCTFHAAFIHHISWRPTFRFYNTWVSLLGAVLCCSIMVVMSWLMAVVTVAIFFILYLLVLYRQPVADWGSSREAQRYRDMIASLVHMTQHQHSVKGYNPQPLVLAGPPGARPALLQIAQLLTSGSYSVFAEIFKEKLSRKQREERCASGDQWLASLRCRGFYAVLDGHELESGARALMQAAGLGRLAPNLVLVGYKYDWALAKEHTLLAYVGVIRLAFEHQLGVTILRTTPDRRARQPLPQTISSTAVSTASERSREIAHNTMHADSDTVFTELNGSKKELEIKDGAQEAIPLQKSVPWHLKVNRENTSLTSVPAQVDDTGKIRPISAKHEFLDAWWLYDDGGLNILLPYIIAYRGATTMPMRIYALARQRHKPDEAKSQMEMILSKFRIRYESLVMLDGVGEAPAAASWDLFNELILKFRVTDDSLNYNECAVTEAELARLHAKTSRQLRLRELLLQHSGAAAFVVMTLPVPRKGTVSAPLYMAWLEVLSRGLPPMLFVRGTDTAVLSVDA